MPIRAQWTADPELCSLMGAEPGDLPPTSDLGEETRKNREWLKRRHQSGARPYAVEVEGRYIGDIDFGIYPGERKADLTVFFGDRSEWGKGYGTEAVELVIHEIYSDSRIDFIEVDVWPVRTIVPCVFGTIWGSN